MGTTTPAYRFGAAQIDAEQRQLLIDGQPAKLGARAFDVLLALVERRDRTVSKNELLELVWPGMVVEENNLQVHISTLRKLLGPQAIATIPGRGYRFTVAPDASAKDAPPIAAKAPATPAATAAPTNLPAHQDPLYGRAEDASAVGELLRTHAQVSIVGASGIGKTRLGLAVAAAQREHFPDGVWWVELAVLNDGALIAGAIAHVLGMRAGGERPALETVVALLRNQTALLVLDNCEHLLDAAAECVRVLLRNAPALRVLVTSQEALRTPEEQVYRLDGLPFTNENRSDAPAPAVELFVARAKAADPRFQLTPEGLTTVAEICRRLDGMPLAIELAAARVRLLGIEGLRARLDERFHILTGGTRAVLRRHQTLRAALEWSYGLLTPDEQTVFYRLGVFVGGFTLELAQDVASGGQIDRWAVLDLLGHLVDKSLVIADGNDLPRYRLLETVRTFALEKLAIAGETPTLLRRHAEALLAFLLPLDDRRWTLKTADQVRIGAELDNLRAALGWAESAAGDRALACTLIGSSGGIWLVHDLLHEGIERALRLLPLPDGVTRETEARFNLLLGLLGYIGVRRECFRASLRAAELYRALRNTPRLIDALIFAAQIGSRLGEAQQVAAAIAEAEALIGADAPPRQAAALALSNAVNYLYLGQHEQAVESALRQAAIYRDSGNEWGVHLALANAALHECGLGRFDSAIVRLRTALDALRRINAPYGVGSALQFLAFAHALRGDRNEALANGRACIPYLQGTGDPSGMLLAIALLHARHGAEDRAASLLGYVDRAFARTGRIVFPMLQRIREEIMERVQAAFEPVEFDRQRAAGAALTQEQALALAFDDLPAPDRTKRRNDSRLSRSRPPTRGRARPSRTRCRSPAGDSNAT
jgi:predicted ATPase/DNA-binding winged helix-turn-helix (wHTH) protein